ncbi:hypothetical protein [Oenococcus oeni]|uniref:Uncharacterized protein n=14 Tax=Oenococcus oeni TaxID=1247 RepID=Q04FJ2_OENOB|nr:hypothetical protein [Oenococcus oeni]ABJ56780.1 hypothetical protein OEOE_0862 [Oenococcus oeni PSU-1]AWW99636.1 hypothetical protein C5H79_09310 [Oenococcus oeni]EFD88633.1 hypothetical protein AWRIB429_0833 [Oenococcus oeni AWRIB429]EJN91858.1 hypothetical protein AWRIB304_1504 [Oenococcus oeni AWRIB304]EJN98767.1 hypothetical protein AWRIB419_1637 [Oenococcus oeni AWRIB419]
MTNELINDLKILREFDSGKTQIEANFLNRYKDNIDKLSGEQLFVGKPNFGGNWYSYWLNPRLTQKGKDFLILFESLEVLEEIFNREFSNFSLITQAKLNLLNYLSDNDLINFNRKTKITAKGIIIYKPEKILIRDRGYNLLSATDLTDINDYLNKNKENLSNPNITNSVIVENGQIDSKNNRIIFGQIDKKTEIKMQRNRVLNEFSRNLKHLSDGDILKLRNFLNSISENGDFDQEKLNDFFDQHPNLINGINTITQIIFESGKSFAIGYIKNNFPGIF